MAGACAKGYPQRVVRSSRRLVDAVVLLGLAGCGDSLNLDVRYRVLGLPAVTAGQCAAPSTPPVATGATKVRFTFRDRPGVGGAPGALRCDAVLPRDARDPVISVPRKDEPVDLWVEYFDDAGTLLARGERTAVELTGGDTVTILAATADGYGCAPAQATAARAFHSATLLPSGEVLLFGGLVTAPGGGAQPDAAPAAGAYVTAAAEIYDPVNQRVFPLALPIAPRAFHHVTVLGTTATGQVVLAVSGGLGVNGTPTTVGNIAAIGGPAGEAPWRPVPAGAAPQAGSAAVPAEILLYDPVARSVTRTELTGIPALAFSSGGQADAELGAPPLIGGGLGTGGDRLLPLGPDGAPGAPLTGTSRLGAALVRQSAATALWVGGALDGAILYDRVSGLDVGTPTIAAGLPPPAAELNRAFAAATRVGPRVYSFGGLTIAGGTVTDSTAGTAGFFVGSAGAVTPLDALTLIGTGYGAAVSAPGPSALYAGGVIAGDAACGPTLACVSSQSVRVDATAATATGAPGLARYGHQLTQLADGTILVSGGFVAGATAGTVRPVATLELFEPRRAADDPIADLGLTRAPGDVAREGGVPVAPCTIVRGVEVDAAVAIDAAEVDALDIDAP